MAGGNDKREQAKALFLQGVAIAEIARRIGMSRKQVGRWKTDDGWESLRSSLPQPDRPLKIVSFDRPRDPQPVEHSQVKLSRTNYNTLDGQLAVIDELLDFARTEAASPTSPQTYGAALNAFSKLLAYRNQLKPIDNEELVREVARRYKTPVAAAKALREAEWHDSA